MDYVQNLFKRYRMNSKKWLFCLAFGLLLSATSYQIYLLANIEIPQNSTIQRFNQSEEYEFETLSGIRFGKTDFPINERPILFMYFDPSCDDCHIMVEKIKKHYSEFENIYVYLITEAQAEQGNSFADRMNLSKYRNLRILLDKKQIMYRKFGLISTPSFVVFNPEFQEVKIIDGNFNFSIVVKYVREAIKESSRSNN
jgi:thioredoxin-related protein